MFGIGKPKIIDPYNTMGAARDFRAVNDRQAAKRNVERIARKWGLTLEAAAEFAPAMDDAETRGVYTRRGSRASDFCDDILNDPKNRKDWYQGGGEG